MDSHKLYVLILVCIASRAALTVLNLNSTINHPFNIKELVMCSEGYFQTCVLYAPHYHIIASYHEGGDLRLRGSPNTDHSDHSVIQVIRSPQSLRNRRKHREL